MLSNATCLTHLVPQHLCCDKPLHKRSAVQSHHVTACLAPIISVQLAAPQIQCTLSVRDTHFTCQAPLLCWKSSSHRLARDRSSALLFTEYKTEIACQSSAWDSIAMKQKLASNSYSPSTHHIS